MSNDTILEFRNIDKSFPGVQALDQVSFGINKGEVHALVGENGAGKSTLMKITAGLYQPDSGEVILNGEAVQIKNAQQALRLGVAMVPQELNLVPETMIAENIFLGIEPCNKLGVVNRRALHHQAGEVLASLGLEMDTRQKVKDLAVAEQQMIQIARALAFNCNILIMDEPTAPLSEREKNVLFERIRALQTRGTTIIYISHRMEEIFEISDRITVLRDGKLMRTLDRSEATQDEIVSLMIGRSLQEFLHTREQRQHGGETILEVRGFAREGLFEDISFSLHRGEILGFAGLVGAGRTETLSSLFGSPPPDRGDVLLKGKTVTIRTPTDAIGLGIGYVPEERKRQGLFPIMSVLQNISIPFLKRLQRLTVIKRKDERLEGEQLSQQLRVQTPSMSQQVGYLSGGNQQKVILARWLGSGSGILILDEPTRGIDVNAKAEIHALITNMVNEGKSIILISSELQELLALADRIIVMREGHIVGEVYPEDVTEEEILRMAMWGINGNGTTSGISADVDETEKGGNSD
jgi:ABC-type sugar transport system ATPase subunit